jgi:hypothetical protein
MSEQIERDIEAILEGRVGRGCVLCHLIDLPFTAFQMILPPGERILMSPLEGDTAFFGALAVGSGPS